MITKPRFKLPLAKGQAYDLLLAAYMAEVEYRQRSFMYSDSCQQSIQQLAEALTADKPKFGIMLCGTCGNGKTTLVRALQKAIAYMYDRDMIDEDMGGLFMTNAKVITSLAKENTREYQRLCNGPMLAVDDMGCEASEVVSYGNVLSPMVSLIEHRYDEQLFTIFTTNLTANEIRTRYGTRIADRFNEMLEVIIFTGETFRR